MTRIVFCALFAGAAFAQKPTKAEQFFDKRVAPILTKRCLGCHNDQLNNAGLSFQDRGTLLKGGSRGPVLVPGKPEESILIHAVRQDGNLTMPPGGKLSSQEITTLSDWIVKGAIWGTKLRK